METINTKDIASYEKRSWTRIINGLSGFKSVNLVGTVDLEGCENLSVISSFFHLGARPPMMGFVVRPHSDKSPRHTLLNLKEVGYYTMNAVNEKNHVEAHQASARYPSDVSEFEKTGLKSIYRNSFKAPYVDGSPIQVGLKLVEVKDVEHNGTHIVLGEIVEFHLAEGLLEEDGFVNLEAGGVLALSGLDSYHETQKVHRLSYAKPGVELREF